MWLDTLALDVRNKSIDGLPAGSVFIHDMPADVDVGVLLLAPYQGMPIDAELPGFHRGQFQVLSRAKKSLTAEQIAEAVMDHLSCEGTTIGALDIHYIRPRHLPVPFPKSKGDYYEASVNFDICFVRHIG